MIKYFILIGIILVMCLIPRIESMNILQQFKTSHKNLLNQIINIRNMKICYMIIYIKPLIKKRNYR